MRDPVRGLRCSLAAAIENMRFTRVRNPVRNGKIEPKG
jgi:hypothetical protein